MKKTARILSVVLMLMLVLSLFAGCGSKDEPAKAEDKSTSKADIQKPAEEKKDEPKPATLSVTYNWFGADAHAAWTKWAFEDFQQKYPHIKLDINEVPSDKYRAKLRADFMANSATDIVLWYSGAELYDYVRQNLVLDITPVMSSIKNDFLDGTLNNMTFDGKNFGVPLCQNFFALYINKDVYAKHGLEYPKTYEQLLEQVKQLKSEGLVPIMLPGQNHPAMATHFYSFIANMTTKAGDTEKAAYGIDGKSYKDEGFVKAAEIMAELQKAGAFDPNIDGIPMASVEDMFVKEQGAMYFIGIWRIGALPKDLREKMHPILFPAVEGFSEKPNIATAQTEMGWIISNEAAKDEAKMDAVKTWIEYFGSKEVSQKHAELTDTVIPLQKDVDLSKASYAVKQSAELVKNSESRPFNMYYQSPAQGGANNEMAWNLINGRLTVDENIENLANIPVNTK